MGIQFVCDVCEKEITPEQLIIQIAAHWHTLKRNQEDICPSFDIFNLYMHKDCADRLLIKLNETVESFMNRE
jgi:hypothetical protein